MAGEIQTASAISWKDAVSDVGTVQLYPLGSKREEDGQIYRYCEVNDATVTLAAGVLVYRGSTQASLWEITGDVSDSDSAFCVGAAMGAIADNGFGWVKTKGYVASLKKKPGTAAYSLAKGDVLVAAQAATDDGRASRLIIAASTKVAAAELRSALERPIGWAAAAATKSSLTCAAYISCED